MKGLFYGGGSSVDSASDSVEFVLDGRSVRAFAGESLWQCARRLGVEIPHLCWRDAEGYRADGNCRACMVEIEGERVLAPSCRRAPVEGMKVSTTSRRAESARRGVVEMLLADSPPSDSARDRESTLALWAKRLGLDVESSRYPRRSSERVPSADSSHPAMRVNLDACIHCGLCARACREVQVNDVIGLAGRGAKTKVVFDFDDAMGESTCVACGECVQACPTGALMPATIVDSEGRGARECDRSVDSVCPYCGVGCQLSYKIRDGAIAWVEGRDGPANQNRLCVKGRFGFDYVASSDRLTTPLLRLPDAPKSVDAPSASSEEARSWFRSASWDEALDVAAEGLIGLRDRFGASCLAGFGSAKGSNEEAYLFQKLVRLGFGSNNVDHCTRLCHASSVAALMENIGSGAVTAPFTAVADSDVIVVIGANPTENHPVAATYLKQAAARGATLIVIDPRRHALSRHATHRLQFSPGSDPALLNAMMSVIVEEGLHDSAFISERTEGFERLREHLRAFSPESVSASCGVSPEAIREAARVYARAKAAIIFWGMGISQHAHGTDNARCLISLALLCGHVGRPGTGLHPLRGQNNVQGASDAGLIPMVFPDYRKVEDAESRSRLESLWGAELSSVAGLTVVEIVDAAARGEIRGMYIMGENPAMSDPNLSHARSGLANLDHLVAQDLFLTETARFADVILPAAAWPEKDGTVTNTNRQVQMGRRAIDPPGDSRPDWRILIDMARRFGLEWGYDHPRDVFAEMKRAMPSLDHITWDRLERDGSATYPCRGVDVPGDEIVFGDRFPTPSGRARMTPADVVPPAEVPDSEYPFVLTTGRQLEHWHTGAMTRRSEVLDALEPSASVSLNPKDLARLGARAGDWLRVASRRGAIELAARSDDGVPEGVLFIPFAYVEAAANVLTNPTLDPFGKIPEFKYCAVKAEHVAAS